MTAKLYKVRNKRTNQEGVLPDTSPKLLNLIPWQGVPHWSTLTLGEVTIAHDGVRDAYRIERMK